MQLRGPAMAIGASADAAADRFREQAALSLGVPPGELKAVRLEGGRSVVTKRPEALGVMRDPKNGEYGFRLYRFAQMRAGIPVLGAGLLALVRNAPDNPVVWAASTLRDLGDFAVKPGAVARAVDARASARSLEPTIGLGGKLATPPSALARFTDPELVVFAGVADRWVAPRLAIHYRGESDTPAGMWRFVADADSGEILHVEDLVHRVAASGSVRGNATVGYGSAACADEVSTPLGNAEVSTLSGATGFTGPLGGFYLPNAGPSPVTVSSSIGGLRFDVVNVAGASEALSLTVAPPAQARFLHNQTNADHAVRAQVNGYVFATEARNFVLNYLPDYPTISTQQNFPVNVNVACEGDGSYGFTAISLCGEIPGGVYNNMAFGTPIFHEYGHHIVATGGEYPMGQGEYGEGMADAIATLISGDPWLGRGWVKGDCDSFGRTADNDCWYSPTECSSCGDYLDVHGCGRLLSGAIWDVRQELSVTHPADYRDIVNRLTLGSILMRHGAGGIDATIAASFLTLDDDDGNEDNGTPHRTEICAGFAAHGLDCPVLPPTDPCSAYCAAPLVFNWSGDYQSGPLGTGTVCRQTTQPVTGGNCGQMAPGRRLYVNGTEMVCNGGNWASVPPPVHGGYCVHATPGDHAWAFFTLW